MSKNNTKVTQYLPLKSILANKNHSRKTMNDEKFKSLKASFEKRGQLQPILVQEIDDGKYELVAGFRRYRAAKELGWKTILACIDEDHDSDAAAMDNLVENLIREDLNPIEEAEAMQAIISSQEMNQHELAEELGVSDTYVSQRLKLLENASDTLKEALSEGVITNTSALDIADLPEEEQEEVIEKIEKQQAKGQKTRVTDIKTEVEKRKKKSEDPDLSDLAAELKDKFKEGNLRTKNEIINESIRLTTKFYADESNKNKDVLKGQIAFAEWVLSLRDEAN